MRFRLGKRGSKHFEHQKLRVWLSKEAALLREFRVERLTYFEQTGDYRISTDELNQRVYARLRRRGFRFLIQIPTFLIYDIEGVPAPQVALILKRLRSLDPWARPKDLACRAVKARLEGATAFLV